MRKIDHEQSKKKGRKGLPVRKKERERALKAANRLLDVIEKGVTKSGLKVK